MRREYDCVRKDTLSQDQFVRRIAPKIGCTNEQANQIWRIIRDEIKLCLLEGLRIKIQEIGTLETRWRKGRAITGGVCGGHSVPEMKCIHLKPSAKFNKILNGKDVQNNE